jgi:transcriptional regulator with XRE-family HTH domain
MNIGEKIKYLRKSRDMSQEKFAEYFNITPQAVSKWENGVAYPDITIIPTIAVFFGISIDELFDFDKTKLDNEIEGIVTEAAACRKDNPKKSTEILKTALDKYPNNEVLLNNLLYVLDSSDEVIEIAERLIANTHDDAIKYDALRILAKTYFEYKNYEMCCLYLCQLPELYFSKSELEAKYLRNKDSARKQFIVSSYQAAEMLDILGNEYNTVRDELYDLIKKSNIQRKGI